MNVLQAAKEDSGEIYIVPYMARFDTFAFSAELLQSMAAMKVIYRASILGKQWIWQNSWWMKWIKQCVPDTDERGVLRTLSD